MQMDQLNHFYEAARRSHIGRAAEFLRVSPSGISYSISCLESDLGTKLFAKRGRRIVLTDAGRRLLEKLPDLKGTLDSIRSHVASENRALTGHLRVGAAHVYCEMGLLSKVQALQKENPEITCDVFTLRSADVILRVLDQSLDLGVCFSPQKHPQLETKILSDGLIKIYVAKKHPLLKVKNPANELNAFCAMMPKAFGGIDVCESHPVFKAHQIKPRVTLSFDSYGVGIRSVSNSNDWGFFPDWFENVEGFDLVALKLPATWNARYTIQAVWTKNRVLSGPLQRLLDQLREEKVGDTFNRINLF